MRFAELQLQAYGHFTDRPLVFKAAPHDLQLIFGANEAGKSTAREAIADFLFGFPQSTPLNFLHAYADLRIGARIEGAGDDAFTAVRKKGRKNTLLDDTGEPANPLDSRLARQLAGADRAFFTRMFSLDHDGLREGGKALAATGAGADTALLSAGSGLADILAERERLAAEAEALWSPNPAASRRYYQAEARLKQADHTIRTHEITASEWRRLRDALASAEADYDALAERRREAYRQWIELERIRRVAPSVRRYHQIESERAELGAPADLGADARTVYDSARNTIDTTAATIERIDAHIARLDESLAKLRDDPSLREAAPTIERLGEQRLRVDDDRERLAEIDAEQHQLAEALAHARQELGWASDSDGSETVWPSASDIARARRLADDAKGHARDVAHAAENLAAAREAETRLTGQAEANGQPRDTDALQAWLAAATREGDLEAELRAGQTGLDQIRRRMEQQLADLKPGVNDVDALAALDVPQRDEIDTFGASLADAETAYRELDSRVAELADETTRARDALQRQRADDEAPSAGDLAQARQQRDICWQLVRQRYVDRRDRDLFDAPIDDAVLDDDSREHPAEALDAAIQRADRFADTRFAHHEAIAEDSHRQRQLADQEQFLAQTTERRDAAHAFLEGVRTEWAARWHATGVTPGTPNAMRDWRIDRGKILDAREQYTTAQATQEARAYRITTQRTELAPYLAALGVADDEVANASLAELIERARRLVAREAQRATDQQRIAHERRELGARLATLTGAHENAERARGEWADAWRAALEPLGLARDLDSERGRAAIDVLADARERDARQRSLTAEQATLVDRRSRFLADVGAVLERTGRGAVPDDLAASAAVQTLVAALRDAEAAHHERTLREKDRTAERERRAEQRQEQTRAQERLAALCERAGVEDSNALDRAIAIAEQCETLQDEQARLASALAEQGDGVALADLTASVEASDLDRLREQTEQLRLEIADLDNDLGPARDKRHAARDAFEAIGGDDQAAVAATERQTALADMTDAAERYLRVGIAAALLKWAGQRYAMDKHGPLIARGSTLMNKLTGGSVAGLAARFDDADELQIVGRRRNNSPVASTAMSEGTADQLYLALRIAAIEDYLERADPLPVIADDLFVNFDDERAIAGLEILAELSQKTQVLFFTHHAHLRDMAIARLGDRIQTHDL